MSVGDGETHGPQMVGDDAHGHVGLLGLAVFDTRLFGDGLDDGLEYIGVVVGSLTLQYADEAFEAHARVDMFGGKLHQLTVGQPVILHEYQVPDFNHLGVVLVDEVAASDLLAGFVIAQVDMDLGAWTTGTRLAHLPEVVLLVAVNDAVLADMLFPKAVGFHVGRLTVFLVATKDGDIEPVFVDFHHLGEVFPCVCDGFFLEIIAKRPVTEHLEHRVVIGVVAHFLQVVMLA